MASGKIIKTFTTPLGRENPVFVQILGICSTLAVTNKLENTIVMTLGVIFTTTLSSFTFSLLRKIIPGRVRMMVETLIIATYVIIVDIVLKAYLPEVWQQLGPYVGLIITNCIVMGRLEAFAASNPPGTQPDRRAGLRYRIRLCLGDHRIFQGAPRFRHDLGHPGVRRLVEQLGHNDNAAGRFFHARAVYLGSERED